MLPVTKPTLFITVLPVPGSGRFCLPYVTSLQGPLSLWRAQLWWRGSIRIKEFLTKMPAYYLTTGSHLVHVCLRFRKKVPARMRGLKLIKKSLDWSINPEQSKFCLLFSLYCPESPISASQVIKVYYRALVTETVNKTYSQNMLSA